MSDGVIQMVYMLLLMFNSMISTSNLAMSISDTKISMYDCAILHGVHNNGKIKIPDLQTFSFSLSIAWYKCAIVWHQCPIK